EIRPDGAFLEDIERRRQRPGAQEEREVRSGLNRESAGDDAAAAQDRLADDRRADHLVVEDDRERLSDVLARDLGEAAGAGGIELEADDGLVVLERRLRVHELLAAENDALAQHIGVRPALPGTALHRRDDLGAGGQPAAAGVLQADSQVYEAEGQLRGASDELLDALGIVDAGELDDNAVLALALDSRFLGAGLVDATAHDLDRLVDHRPARGDEGLIGVAELHRAIRGNVGDKVAV